MTIYTMGVDIGSTTSKCVVLKDGSEIAASAIVVGGTGTKGQERVIQETLSRLNLPISAIKSIISTGYGRRALEIADEDRSEMSCHAKGVFFLHPTVRTIIDIGGQDAKILRINQKGKMVNFVMNDKCAAGTGRFLDVMANILGIDIDEMGHLASLSNTPVSISNTCTVFAESEVISQLASNAALNDILAGICESVASRTASLAKRLGIEGDVFFSGGVALNTGVRNALERDLQSKVLSSEYSQIMGALGASVYAYEKIQKETEDPINEQ